MANQVFRDMDEAELRGLGNEIGRSVEAALPPGCLFVTLYFDDDLVGQYVANAVRADIIKVLRETADRLEGREDIAR